MTFPVLETAYRNADGDHVLPERLTCIELAALGTTMTDRYEQRLTAADVIVDKTGPVVVVEDLEREDFVRYASASGDFNLIYYDEPYA